MAFFLILCANQRYKVKKKTDIPRGWVEICKPTSCVYDKLRNRHLLSSLLQLSLCQCRRCRMTFYPYDKTKRFFYKCTFSCKIVFSGTRSEREFRPGQFRLVRGLSAVNTGVQHQKEITIIPMDELLISELISDLRAHLRSQNSSQVSELTSDLRTHLRSQNVISDLRTSSQISERHLRSQNSSQISELISDLRTHLRSQNIISDLRTHLRSQIWYNTV